MTVVPTNFCVTQKLKTLSCPVPGSLLWAMGVATYVSVCHLWSQSTVAGILPHLALCVQCGDSAGITVGGASLSLPCSDGKAVGLPVLMGQVCGSGSG